MQNPFSVRTLFVIGTLLACPALAGPELPIDIAKAEQQAAERFASADTNADGELTAAEFSAGLAALEAHGQHRDRFRGHAPRGDHSGGHAPWGRARAPEAESDTRAAIETRLFAAMDTDGNGELSPAEASAENRDAARARIMAETAFARLDADANGVLTRAELPDRAARLRTLDADGDGLVTAEELRAGHGEQFAPRG